MEDIYIIKGFGNSEEVFKTEHMTEAEAQYYVKDMQQHYRGRGIELYVDIDGVIEHVDVVWDLEDF